MIAQSVTVVNALGLHARAAARFVHRAGQFRSRIRVARDSQTVDGKSILGLLLLAAARGTVLDLSIDGDDEAQAMAALVDLAARGFEDP
ncbi:MAG: HPr family phosphocarrier protein [Acidimicrobiia bacterium]|nr:HPr family phosphocarrier protein [Acidimicrobiia bacterium]